jgi:hypothetical protein
MKHGKNPTVAQKKFIHKWGLDPTVWLVVKDTPEQMVLVHRYSDKTTKVVTK